MVCDKCLSIVGDAFTESEQLADEKHTYVDSVCTKCGYNNKCKHDGEKKTETVITDDYRKLRDGSAHIHKITITENVYCVDCGILLESKLLSEESTTEPHTEDTACDFCGYVPACKHETVTYTVKQNRVVKDYGNDATHDVETWRVTIRECADCGTELSRNSEFVSTEKVKHSFNLFYRSEDDDENLEICSQCGYSRLATKEAVWADTNSFIQDSTIDLITRWIMNQNGILTASESLSKLPSVIGNPYKAIKELFKKKVSDDYYSDMMKSILLDMMGVQTKKKGTEDIIDINEDGYNEFTKYYKKLMGTPLGKKLQENVKEDGIYHDPVYGDFDMNALNSAIQTCNKVKNKVKSTVNFAGELKEEYEAWQNLMNNYAENMAFLCDIASTVSEDSELYKACLELQSEMLNEIGGFANICKITIDKAGADITKKTLNYVMSKVADFPILSTLSKADKILRTFPNYYVDLNNIVDAKGNMMDLYILRVDVATELMNAAWSDSDVSDSIFDIYSKIVDKEFDAVDTYLKEEQKQQEGFLGWIKEVAGKKNNMTANEWRKQLKEERKTFHDEYCNALEKAV